MQLGHFVVGRDSVGFIANLAAPTISVDTLTPTTAQVSWAAATGGEGVYTYEVRLQIDGGSFSTVATTTSLSASFSQSFTGHTYGFLIRVTDENNNTKDGSEVTVDVSAIITAAAAAQLVIDQAVIAGNLANIKTGVSLLSQSAGTYTGTDRWTDPGVMNVKSGVTYKANSTSVNRTGTFVGGTSSAEVTVNLRLQGPLRWWWRRTLVDLAAPGADAIYYTLDGTTPIPGNTGTLQANGPIRVGSNDLQAVSYTASNAGPITNVTASR